MKTNSPFNYNFNKISICLGIIPIIILFVCGTGAQNEANPSAQPTLIQLNDDNPIQYIQSQGFPLKPYPKNYTANYELNVNLSSSVEQLSSRLLIKLEFIAIEPSDNCLDSNLRIIFPKGEIRVFCGLHASKTMVADSGSALIQFKGNDLQIDRGFKLRAELIRSKCSQKYVNQSQGYVESPNYPNDYGVDETCVWEVVVTEGRFVKLEFEGEFNINTSNTVCAEDYLLISRSGDFQTDVLRFCGNEKPSAVVSHSNKMLIKFSSDCCQTGKGFRAKFAEHDKPEAAPERLPMLTPPDCPCGKENLKLVKRIVGGVEVKPPHRYPWMVSVVSSRGSSYCGATLINNFYVITAAHCVVDEDPETLGARIGQHSLQEATPVLKVSKITIHEKYNPVTQSNDIALLRLKEPVQFNRYVQPVCLPASDLEDPDGLWVAGWGRIDEGGRTSDRLHEIGLPNYSNAKCESKYSGLITQNQLCAGGVKGEDACQGDSGGPLMSRVEGKVDLVGIVSWGIGCARQDYPGVYTRVTAYLKWIADQTRDSTYCLAPNSSMTSNEIFEGPIQPNVGNCGIPNLKLAKRVVGGKETIPREFPWTVVIAYNGELIGSGSLIAQNIVLTSAQRLKRIYDTNSSPDVKVIVGAHDITRSEANKKVYRINQMVIHPKFGYNTPRDYDFALLELKPLADGSLPDVRPVCLPRSDTPYSIGSGVVGVGWGRTSTYSTGSGVLRKVQLLLSDRRKCSQTYGYSVTDSMVCAADQNKDMCLGDNGGPLMQYYNGRMYLFGVYSWQASEGCATGKPSVFADVRYALPWIRDVTNNGIKTA